MDESVETGLLRDKLADLDRRLKRLEERLERLERTQRVYEPRFLPTSGPQGHEGPF